MQTRLLSPVTSLPVLLTDVHIRLELVFENMLYLSKLMSNSSYAQLTTDTNTNTARVL